MDRLSPHFQVPDSSPNQVMKQLLVALEILPDERRPLDGVARGEERSRQDEDWEKLAAGYRHILLREPARLQDAPGR